MLPHEKPDDSIIEDDAKFDKWMTKFMREQAMKLAQYSEGKSGLSEDDKYKSVPMFGGTGANSN